MEATGDTPTTIPLTWAAKSLVLAGGCAVSFAMSAVAPVLAKIQDMLAHGPEDMLLVKMLVGVVGAAIVIGTASTGFLADRVGLKPIFVANFLVFTIAGLAGLFINDLRILIVARFFTGLAGGGAVTASVVVINRMPPGMRSTWMGAYVAVAMLVGIVLRPVTGALGEHDWHWVFAIFVTGAPFVLIAAFWYKEIPVAAIAPAAAVSVAGGDTAQPSILRWFPLRFLAVALLTGTIMFVPTIYVPFLVSEMGIKSPTMISLVLLGDTISAGFIALLYGWARKYLGEGAAFSVTYAIALVGLAVTALAPNYIVVMIGITIFGIAVGWFTPNLLMAIGTRVKPHQQGRAAGLVKGSIYLATPLGVFVAEPIYQLYGTRTVIGACTLIAAILTAIFSISWIGGRAADRR